MVVLFVWSFIPICNLPTMPIRCNGQDRNRNGMLSFDDMNAPAFTRRIQSVFCKAVRKT
jgi:hypothetical protein